MARKLNLFEFFGLKPKVYSEKEYEQHQMEKGMMPDKYKEKQMMEMKVPMENNMPKKEMMMKKQKPKLLKMKKGK